MSETINYKNITAAIVKAMEEIKGVEKNTTVGTGNSSYKGVSDKDVKEVIRKAMIKNGLTILPIHIDTDIDIKSWEEKTSYGPKQKKEVFTRAHVTYRLIHTSGEYIDIQGIGHGVDSQDKSAGKATTYALKYALLYTFLVPTGDIDDADAVHSEAYAPAPVKKAPPAPAMTEAEAITKLRAATTEAELKTVWTSLPAALKKDAEISAVKDEMKETIINNSNA